MRKLQVCWIMLVALGLAAMPALAAELRVTGFVDNVFPRFDINASNSDQDTTRNHDEAFFGRTRARTFFNFIANDNLRGVVAFEFDQSYGAPATDRVSGACDEESAAFPFYQCGFDNGIDNLALEVKQVYADFRIPQLPIGNRWRLGGLPFAVTPLHGAILYQMDAGGGNLQLNFTDNISLSTYYIQLEEDLDRYPGSTKIGEDYLTGATLMLKPVAGLDLHIIGLYGHGQAPFGPGLTSGSGPFNGIAGDTVNVTSESRYYVGFDSRYRFGNTSIEPGFFYLLGTRTFCTPGTITNTTGTPIPCTSPVGSPNSTPFDAYQGHLYVTHAMGPWLFKAKGVYKSGNSANDDINNRGIGNRSKVNGFRYMGVDTSNDYGLWFELLGKSDVDSTGNRTFRRMGEAAQLERFGWIIFGGQGEYKYTDNLTLVGAAGGFWTAEKTGCPAVFRVGSTGGPCTAAGTPRNNSGEPSLNFTGGSRFAGWEVNTGIRYQIMPGLTWTPLLAYADYGDAVSANNRSSMDAWAFVNRVIYIF